LWLLIGALGAVIIASLAMNSKPGLEWTTTSREAEREFEIGLEAARQLYVEDAVKHYERALEIDPGFVAAKMELAANLALADPQRSQNLINEVAVLDLSTYSDREQFLAEYYISLFRGQTERAFERVLAFAETHPRDPYALNLRATWAWQGGDLEEAERLNLELLDVDPNWVLAYNQLGYGAMARGRFTESEEYFTKYRFIAPDQANPFDSLAELYILTGRWEEAEALLEQALKIRSGFVPAVRHIVLVRTLAGDFEGAEEAVTKAPNLAQEESRALLCEIELARLAEENQFEELVERGIECVDEINGFRLGPLASHRAACLRKDWRTAGLLQGRYRRMLDRSDPESPIRPGDFQAALAHMEAVRLAVRGRLSHAEAVLSAADRASGFTTAEIGVFKLLNRLVLARVIAAQGREAEAFRLLGQVEGVNPELVRKFNADSNTLRLKKKSGRIRS
jgi:Flp pilus assembly protein TadD